MDYRRDDSLILMEVGGGKMHSAQRQSIFDMLVSSGDAQIKESKGGYNYILTDQGKQSSARALKNLLRTLEPAMLPATAFREDVLNYLKALGWVEVVEVKGKSYVKITEKGLEHIG